MNTTSRAMLRLLTCLAGAACAASCAGAGGRATPTAAPTAERMVLAPLGTETVTPTPTDTPTPTQTPLPTETPPPSPEPAGPEATMWALEARCDVPRAADLVTFTLAAGTPAETAAAWQAEARHAFVGRVTAHDPVGRAYRLRPEEPAPDVELDAAYSFQPLPIEVDRSYRFTLWSDPPGAPPAGRALLVEDDEGLVALVVAVREAEGAGLRLLGGERAGYAVRQLPSLCRTGPMDGCGNQLRAAPLEVARGDAWLTLGAGDSGAFAYDPPYVVTVRTSHVRLPVGVVPCPDPTDWVQSYRIERQTPTEP